ncbi:basic amino acid ABC transporter substrate-binding protein [Scopulibacillus cellulosilyticus]|uniref:Basic amino acid ABC transporter substrate-binding protein n=1 Tax=Scopulibacillus cellulosilyticus TaxID=2665665 RepID=A0ABW2PS70_9BACL
MKKKSVLISLVLLLALGMLLAGCGKSKDSSSSGSGNSSGGSNDNNTIIVGADTTFPPFESEVNGKVTGFDIDMVKAIAKKEGFKVEIKTMPFEGLIPALQAGSLDMAVAGMTIKSDRMKNVNFSNAYYKSGLSILVKKDSKIKNVKDLKGHLVATKKGTSSVDYLTSHGVNGSDIKQFKDINDAYQALENGGADAVLFDNPVNINFKSKRDNVKIVGGLLTGEYYGIAVNKKKADLLKKVNDGLAKMKKDGEYKKLFDKYLDGDTSGIVNDVKKPEDVAVSD